MDKAPSGKEMVQRLMEELKAAKKDPVVTKLRVRAAVARIISRGSDDVHPEIIKVLQDESDERFAKERAILKANLKL